jgi:hypothetical protein
MDGYARITSYVWGKPETDAQQVNSWMALLPSYTTILHFEGDQTFTVLSNSTDLMTTMATKTRSKDGITVDLQIHLIK